MESGEYRLTRGMRVFARCLEVVAVAGLMWVSWCAFGGAGFSRALHEFAFHIRARVIHDHWLQESQSSQQVVGQGVPTASQSAHRELASTYPHEVYRLVCPHLRNLSLIHI